MIRKEDVYKIGLLTKPHGVKGEIAFSFTDDVFDRVDCEYFICLLEGILVPFYIEEYRFKSDSVALVKFERIDTAEQARRFTNVEVYFPLALAEFLRSASCSQMGLFCFSYILHQPFSKFQTAVQMEFQFILVNHNNFLNQTFEHDLIEFRHQLHAVFND